MENVSYRFAVLTDKEAIEQLLAECELPHEDIGDHLENFIVANNGKGIVGVVGLEVYDACGLIRSLAVKPSYRGKGIAKELYSQILGHAHLCGIRELYLLTLTAEKFFAKLGFAAVNRKDVPEAIKATEEFRSLCPDSAVCMSNNISNEVQYYPKEVLRLLPDIPGAKMWGVSLKKTTFTYFEVAPNSRFQEHRHESEQITYVLEGTLFFEVSHQTIAVRPGEVIAIPSNVVHAAYTTNTAVKAVDAWSPVRKK